MKTIEITVPEGMKLVENKNGEGNVISYQVVKDEPIIESKTKEQEMKEFFGPFLNNLTLVRYEDKCPNSVFFKQDNVFLFELYESQDGKKRYLYVNYDKIWSVFYNRFGLNYYETQEFIKAQVGAVLKLGNITPNLSILPEATVVGAVLKLGNITPEIIERFEFSWWKQR